MSKIVLNCVTSFADDPLDFVQFHTYLDLVLQFFRLFSYLKLYFYLVTHDMPLHSRTSNSTPETCLYPDLLNNIGSWNNR